MSTTTPPSQTMKREDYKTVKRMNKAELTAYLARIYRRGFEAGVEVGRKGIVPSPPPQAPANEQIVDLKGAES